ncbi:MAG: DUF3455 domain-containing protein [Burkholderiales bacterium]
MRHRCESIVMGLALAGCAGTQVLMVPAILEPPGRERLAMTVHADGVQVYECRARKDGAGFEWTFVAPEATLTDTAGKRTGIHGAGPYWQWNDGSRVIGTVKARADAPAPGAIPWLLLSTTNGGPEGALSKVSSIQRVNTEGGVAPADGCGPGTRSALARVAYSADYRMFAMR